MHALIIDDDRMNALVLQKLLESERIGVTIIDHPADLDLNALPALGLIFLDLELPQQDGYEVLHQLREQFGTTIPIVAYTVHITESVNAWQQGFDGFLGKPVSRQDFSSHLRRLLSGERVWAVS